jgi:membrane associated rhomboid family serine protease
VVNTILIGLNVVAFLLEVSYGPRGAQRLIEALGVVPAAFIENRSLHEFSTLFTSMFLHAGWMHLFSNMLALYIFGDNVEDVLGPVRYLLFYLVCGLAAGLTHIFVNRYSTMPTIGASGAIGGVLGGYLVLFPKSRVLTIIPPFFFWLIEIPAALFLGLWFLSQLANGALAIVQSQQTSGGVAFWSHAGGFVTGAVLVRVLARRRQRWQEYPGAYS